MERMEWGKTYLPEMMDFMQLSYLCKPRAGRLLHQGKNVSALVHCNAKRDRDEIRTTNRFRASNPRFQAVSHSNSVPGTNS
jgi:hypothetical protein